MGEQSSISSATNMNIFIHLTLFLVGVFTDTAHIKSQRENLMFYNPVDIGPAPEKSLAEICFTDKVCSQKEFKKAALYEYGCRLRGFNRALNQYQTCVAENQFSFCNDEIQLWLNGKQSYFGLRKRTFLRLRGNQCN